MVIKSFKKVKNCKHKGSQFDSNKEGGEARDLDRKLEKGEIKRYQKQFRVDFFIKYIDNNPVIIANPDDPNDRRYSTFFKSYLVDFMVVHNDDTIEFIEVKGLVSQDWKQKWILLEAVYGNHPNYKLTLIK